MTVLPASRSEKTKIDTTWSNELPLFVVHESYVFSMKRIAHIPLFLGSRNLRYI